ncbi:MAG: hypothetical protein IKO36_05950 [Bacteroidaceae bacterium]|nr:hypothetical protein [Bacteroidaceae bacterium]
MLYYTNKDINKLFTDVLAGFIADGAVFDLNNNNYASSGFDSHVDLIDKNGEAIVLYKKTGRNEAFRSYRNGVCVIKTQRYEYSNGFRHSKLISEETLHTLYQYYNIFTDDADEYNKMVEKGNARRKARWDFEHSNYEVKYDPSVILNIVRKRKGFKRTKQEHIMYVHKYDKDYHICINNGRKHEIIVIKGV